MGGAAELSNSLKVEEVEVAGLTALRSFRDLEVLNVELVENKEQMLSVSEPLSGLEFSNQGESPSGRDLQIEWLLGVEGVDRSKEVSIVVVSIVVSELSGSISSIATAPIFFEVVIVLIEKCDCDEKRTC